MPAPPFELSPPPGDAISSVAFAPDTNERLLVSSWDKNVYYYSINGAESSSLIATIEHRAPVLDVCFGDDENEAFTAGVDCCVNRIDLTTREKTLVGKHTAPVRSIGYSRSHGILVSASWDCSLNLYNTRDASSSSIRIPLPAKPQSLAVSPSKVVVAMTGRIINIYTLDSIQQLFSSGGTELKPWQQRESSLRYLTRTVACMPNDLGYATSSIEGRVAVEWFEDTPEVQARKFAFKCHRQPSTTFEGDLIFPVNGLSFHPGYGTLATGGGDGTVALWDPESKRRLRVYPKSEQSVASIAYSHDGRFIAIGICPGFEAGQEDYSGAGATSVIIRELGDGEAKGRANK